MTLDLLLTGHTVLYFARRWVHRYAEIEIERLKKQAAELTAEAERRNRWARF
jgi:hypothetical protein